MEVNQRLEGKVRSHARWGAMSARERSEQYRTRQREKQRERSRRRKVHRAVDAILSRPTRLLYLKGGASYLKSLLF